MRPNLVGYLIVYHVRACAHLQPRAILQGKLVRPLVQERDALCLRLLTGPQLPRLARHVRIVVLEVHALSIGPLGGAAALAQVEVVVEAEVVVAGDDELERGVDAAEHVEGGVVLVHVAHHGDVAAVQQHVSGRQRRAERPLPIVAGVGRAGINERRGVRVGDDEDARLGRIRHCFGVEGQRCDVVVADRRMREVLRLERARRWIV